MSDDAIVNYVVRGRPVATMDLRSVAVIGEPVTRSAHPEPFETTFREVFDLIIVGSTNPMELPYDEAGHRELKAAWSKVRG